MRLVLSFNVVGQDKNYRASQEILLLSNSADWLQIMCTVVNGPVHRQVDAISIYRLSANDTFKLVATIQSYESDAEDYREPSSISHDIPGIKAVGSLKDEIEYLEVSIPVSELTCEFSSMYKCSVSYSIKDGSHETKGTTSITRNLKLAGTFLNI
ncbi:hypothetical protein DPMN_144223 [Dreissena polymorpha]|uniref:Uncharacterized protein n=1 Tax=Dreissena polymorpha TaxID=45954 RepID=A0A9D4GHQ2_DREPO|nr:hypothetical protein DPMN_144121 [Dreissena polymorpha]KAH3815692.1 hypothetical protein DPMN_144223 [Dreissena polymorpha]